jgi:hypothetical protein
MPVLKKFNRPGMFGPSNIFCITDWKGFLGALDNEVATIVGTINEVATPWGTGIEVGVADSYVTIDWTSQAPLLTGPRTIFSLCYLPDSSGDNFIIMWGSGAARNGFYVRNLNATFAGGFEADLESGGTLPADWFTIAVTNTGVNGGANIVYGNGGGAAGGVTIAGANVGNGVTTYTDLHLLTYAPSPLVLNCPVGTIMQVALVFNQALSAADIARIHNDIMGLGINP